MAYTFTTTQVAVPMAVKTAQNLPILLNSNKQLDTEFKAGNGSSMNIVIPQHPDVTTGAVVTEGQMAQVTGSVALTLTQRKVAIGADQVVRALDIKDFDSQIASPYGARLASEIQTEAANEVLLQADSEVVITSATGFQGIADAVSYIRAARSYGDLFGAFSPVMAAKVSGSGLGFFNPSAQVTEMYKENAIGRFAQAEWFTTPDVGNLVTGTLATTSGTLSVTANTSGEGTTALTLDATTVAGTLTKGESFTIDGVNRVDIFGNDTGIPFVFVAQALATAAANSITVTVQPLYFAAGAKKNVSVTAILADKAVTLKLDRSATYARGIVWDKMSLYFGSASLAPMAGSDAKVINDPKGLSMTCTKGPDIMNGREIVRWDTLTGFKLARPSWASRVLYKIA